MAKIISKEVWSDGTPVRWSVEVREIPMEGELLDEWYDRDAKPNRELIEEGAKLRAFVVETVLELPDEEKSNDEDETIAGNEFRGIEPGDTLVVFMNHKEYVEKEGSISADLMADFSPWPTLINVQDVGFDVEVEQ